MTQNCNSPQSGRPLRALLTLLSYGIALPAALHAEPPETVCTEVNSYWLAPPKVFWHNGANCIPGGGEFDPINPNAPEVISRVGAAGGMPRNLMYQNPARPVGQCNTYHVNSNVMADANHVYWVDDSGLVRLSTNANLGDPPQLVSATITGDDENRMAELVPGNATDLFARTYDGTSSRIYRVPKQAPASAVLLVTITGRITQLSYDGKYLYYLRSGVLWRLDFAAGITVKQIDTSVTGYHAEGRRSFFPAGSTEYVWFAKGRSLYRYDNVADSTSAALYTSTDTTGVIYSITSIGGGGFVIIGQPAGVYFLERRTVSGNPFNFYNQLLFRIPRGGGTGENLYFRSGTFPVSVDADHLTNDGYWLFWKDVDRVLRLSADADELEKTNMRITALEVTQAIQSLANTVPLIEGKRTFVRMHVRSDDPSRSVPSVMAHVSATWTGGSGGPLSPINSGVKITVHPNPDRTNINHSFLFEIPHEWTARSNLRLFGDLNPYHLPLQNSYANNEMTVGPFNFLPSPRMELELFAFRHEVNDVEYAPDYEDDVLPTLSWIRRVYPISSSWGGLNDPGPGLRVRVTYVFDADLGARVNRTDPVCQAMPKDDRSLCATNYVNAKLGAWRAESSSGAYFYYGLMDDQPLFPRGRKGGDGVASGPAGPHGGWDTDTTYGDWYTGHELGHVLGRPHPNPASDNPDTEDTVEGCGHSRSDPNFPYANALIGPPGEVFMGFDAGWQNLPKAVLPSATWSDLMSYCNFQWISDYTYNAMYNRFDTLGFVDDGAGLKRKPPRREKGLPGGPWLSLFGTIHPSADLAMVHYLRKIDSVASLPPSGFGQYQVELLDSDQRVLSMVPFNPESDDGDGSSLPFGVIVPWQPDTKVVRIYYPKDDVVLFEKVVSGNAPSVAGPQIPGAGGGPLEGVQTLVWTGSDADGDQLCYDLLSSTDGGVTFRPILWGLKSSLVELNLDELGGGSVIFRVVATDGVLCAMSDSQPYNVAVKPPAVRITSPMDGTVIEYGQLLTFAGEADDAQDGSVPAQRMVWTGLTTGARGSIGDMISTSTLPVGENIVTLTATNSHGVPAQTSITVHVTDDLTNPPGMFSVSPLILGWEVRSGGPSPAPKTLNVSTAGGGGTFNWTAQEDASWLSLSATQGTTPSMLTLSANANNLMPGQVYNTEVTLTTTTNPPRVVVVPVTLSLDFSNYLGPIGPLAGGYLDRDRDCLPDWWENQYAESRPEDSDAMSDGDSDGLIDLYEYGVGTDPTMPTDPQGHVEPAVVSLNGETFFLFTYTRRINDPNLAFEPEVSLELIDWLNGPEYVQELNTVGVDATLEEVTVRITPPTVDGLPAGTAFVRLRVSKAEPR